MPSVEQYLAQHYQGSSLGPLNSDTGAAILLAQEVTFTETTGAGVYTATVPLPAGVTILDIKVRSLALWTATTSAVLNVGDGGSANGWYAAVNLKATDLVVGQELNFVNPGGKNGAYLATTSGVQTVSAAYHAAASNVIAVVTTVGAAGAAGLTRMLIVYATDMAPTAATKV